MSAKENCFGEYLNVDPNNTLCINDLQVVDKVHDLDFNLSYVLIKHPENVNI